MRDIVAVMQGKVAGVSRPTVASPGRPAPAPGNAAVINWGERCCAKDLAELRTALRTIQRTGAPLQNASGLSQLSRRSSALQVGAMVGQVSTTLDSFANARDAAVAASVLNSIARQLDQLARVVTGTQ
jgi:hypothetical protein